MRVPEKNGAEIHAIGMECRVEVPLLPTKAQGVARVVREHYI